MNFKFKGCGSNALRSNTGDTVTPQWGEASLQHWGKILKSGKFFDSGEERLEEKANNMKIILLDATFAQERTILRFKSLQNTQENIWSSEI